MSTFISGDCTVCEAEAERERQERQLQAARESFIGWRIFETVDGYAAVPKYSYTIEATDLDDLVRQLREG
jgi:hypothetical protein